MALTRIQKIVRFGLATALTAGGLTLLTPAGPAQAATARNGVCESGEFCLYFYDNRGGSVSDFNTSIKTYGASQPSCYDYKGPGSGKGACVKNNAQSYWNRTGHDVVVFTLSNYDASDGFMATRSGWYGNLNSSVYNDNASHKII